MKKFVKLFSSQKGFTLIEMIVALSLFTVVAGIIGSITMFGFRSYNTIMIQNQLRDEADLLMSSVITELYTFAPDEVIDTIIPGDSGEIIDSYIILNNKENGSSSKIRIANGELTISDPNVVENPADHSRTAIKAIVTSGSAITLECRDQGPCDSGLITINLVLSRNYDDRDYQLELTSKFGF